jgi:hypothetical protein
VLIEEMKTTLRLLAGLLFATSPLSLRAQNTNAQATPPPPPQGGGNGPMANLSEAERAQVKAAHDKAIQQNPALDQKMKAAHQAMEEARKSMHEAMIAVDPTVESILAKMMPPKWGGKHDVGPGNANGQVRGVAPGSTNSSGWQQAGHHEPPGMANLSETERQQLKSLHEQVKTDPSVIAARQAKQGATTPEARNAAEEALHQAMHDAMIKADPSVEAILSKLHPAGGNVGQPAASPSAIPMAQ